MKYFIDKPPIVDRINSLEWETKLFINEKNFKPDTEFFVITKEGEKKRLGTIEDLIEFAETMGEK